MNQIIVPEVDSRALADQVMPVVERARALTVKTQEDDEVAQQGLLACAKAEKFIRSIYKAPKAVLDKAHKDLCAEEAQWLDPIREAKGLYFSKHTAYVSEQERLAREKAARLAEEARRQEEERRLQDAALADMNGSTEEAEAILSEPIAPVAVEVPVSVTAVKGVGKARKVWGAEVFDLRALIKWVAARIDQDPGVAAYLEPSLPALNAIARAQKAALKIDGVRAVERAISNVRV